jgi:hypothetical protein
MKMPRLGFRIMRVNRYNLQYWIWAILNKEFGNQIKLKRSWIASMYDVNKHDFQVFAANDDILKRAYDHLIDTLEDSGYVQDGSGSYMKAFDGILCYIHPKFSNHIAGNHKVFSCSSYTYNAL